jgi:thiamine phosphate synthase YjbQ (UPF0047 family)
MFRAVFWVVLPPSSGSLMMEAVRTSETSVDNHFTRQYNSEDDSEHHTRRRENLISHIVANILIKTSKFIQNKMSLPDLLG